MKKLLLSAVLGLFAGASFAQTDHSGHAHHQQASRSNLAPVLNAYYELKDALVASNSELAAGKAAALEQTVNAVDPASLKDKEKAAFGTLKAKLSGEAHKIAGAKKLESQRSAFASLSLHMWDLLKSAEGLEQPAYQQYCPMKKTYWISRETTIRNPYYGQQMLSCGNTTGTLK